MAESRRDPENKQYVQNLVEKDVEFIHEHLFKRNGVIFICGGTEMAKEINNCIFKAVSLECKVPYKAYTMGQSLRANKTIVEEIFG